MPNNGLLTPHALIDTARAAPHRATLKSTIGRPRALTNDEVTQVLTWHGAIKALNAQRKALKTLRQLAGELGVPPSTVYNVIRRRGEYKLAPPVRRARRK